MTPAGGCDPHDDIGRHLVHLQVERRLAQRTRAIYADAFRTLRRCADEAKLELRRVEPPHVRRWAGQLHRQGLAPRSIALVLSAWRGLYRWLGRDGLVAANPVDGVRAPKAGRPLPKALSVDHAVALADAQPDDDTTSPALAARDHCIVELLYGCGLRVGELVGLDVGASAAAAGWVDAPDATVHVTGKGGKRRSVPAGPPALQALATWLAQRTTLAAPNEPRRQRSEARGRLRLGLRHRLRIARRQLGDDRGGRERSEDEDGSDESAHGRLPDARRGVRAGLSRFRRFQKCAILPTDQNVKYSTPGRLESCGGKITACLPLKRL